MKAVSQQKPALSFWQIWNMCFGFMGIQFGFALQQANISRIFQTLGADMSAVPILMIAAPLTGLIVQPIVGFYSDRTWNRLGRRRPYFLWGAILTTAALFVMPHSPTLWIAAGMLWILDAALNVTMEPFRAFVGDMLPPRQRTFGYVMQTILIGIGAVVASAMPYIFANYFGVDSTAGEGEIPDVVRYSFYCGGIVLMAAVAWTVFRTKEYSPQEMEQFAEAEKRQGVLQVQEAVETVFDSGRARWWCIFGVLSSLMVLLLKLDWQLYILTVGVLVYGVIQLVNATREASGFEAVKNSHFYQACRSVVLMPKTMKQLAWVQFFSWFPLFTMWTFLTPAVTSHHFLSDDPQSLAYNEGANWVSLLFAVYSGVSILAAAIIPVLARAIGIKLTHQFNLLLGALGLASFAFIDDPQWLLLSMVGVGFAWASILSIPYAILSNSLPGHSLGIYMGVFNIFIVIPQLVAASILGLILSNLMQGNTMSMLILAACFWLVAALSVFIVDYQD